MESSNRFKAYLPHPIDMKLVRSILDISLHIRSDTGFPMFPRGRCWSLPLEIFKPIHSLQYSIYTIEMKLGMIIQLTSGNKDTSGLV